MIPIFCGRLLMSLDRYGIGVAAHRGGAPWSQFLATSIPYLFQATQIPDARGEEAVYATGRLSCLIRDMMCRSNVRDRERLRSYCKDTSFQQTKPTR